MKDIKTFSVTYLSLLIRFLTLFCSFATPHFIMIKQALYNLPDVVKFISNLQQQQQLHRE